MKKTCLCCGYISLESEIFDICPICYWEDDPACWGDTDFVGGAKSNLSLREAQKNFKIFGACEECMLDLVREPTDDDLKDPKWKTL